MDYGILIYIALALSIASILAIAVLYSSIRRLREQVKLIVSRKVEEALSRTKRIRKRYIVFTIISEHEFNRKEIEKAVRRKLAVLYGLINLAKADPQLVFYDPKLKRGIIRTSHIMKDYVIAALTTTREINGKKLLIIPVKTTGTIKRAKKIMYTIKTKT